MSKPDDPARLFDAGSDTTEGVRAVLRSGQRGLPGPDELARLAARLPLGPLPPPSGTPPAGSLPRAPLRLIAPVAVPSVLPGALVGVVLGLVVVAVMAWRDTVSSPTGNFAAAPVATNQQAPIASSRPVAPRSAEAPVDPAGPARGRAAVSSAPRASAEGPQDEAPALAASGAPSTAGSPSSPSGAGELESEVHLLQRAQSALGADPGAALALAGEHARRACWSDFPARRTAGGSSRSASENNFKRTIGALHVPGDRAMWSLCPWRITYDDSTFFAVRWLGFARGARGDVAWRGGVYH